MILDILPLAGGTARLVRVYGGEPCVKLPGAVPAPEGRASGPSPNWEITVFPKSPGVCPGRKRFAAMSGPRTASSV